MDGKLEEAIGTIIVAVLFIAFWLLIGIPLITASLECNYWAC